MKQYVLITCRMENTPFDTIRGGQKWGKRENQRTRKARDLIEGFAEIVEAGDVLADVLAQGDEDGARHQDDEGEAVVQPEDGRVDAHHVDAQPHGRRQRLERRQHPPADECSSIQQSCPVRKSGNGVDGNGRPKIGYRGANNA